MASPAFLTGLRSEMAETPDYSESYVRHLVSSIRHPVTAVVELRL